MKYEVLYWVGAGVGVAAMAFTTFFLAMARFLKRPSPSEAIIRIGRNETDVFIGRASWVIPVLHRAATLSLSTIGLNIRRAAQEALVSKDFISMNLAAEFYIRVEPNVDDVKKAARTIGIDSGHASSEDIRHTSQKLLEPKLVGALRAVAAQNDFLALHLNREHFAQEVSHALREDIGRNGFTLESVTITELAQTPLSEMRSDDIFGASGRETVTNTVVAKNIAVRKKMQEEAERVAEISKEQSILVAQQDRLLREGKAKEEQAAAIAELAKMEAVEARDLQRQSAIAVERAKKERTELEANIDKQKSIEAAEISKQIAITQKDRERADADAQKATALALLEKAQQEVVTVEHVAHAERQKRVALVAAAQNAEQERLIAETLAYEKAQVADAEARAIKVRALAEAEAAELQAISITKLAEAKREAGLKEAEVQLQRTKAENSKTTEILVAEAVQALIAQAPAILAEMVKPAERIGEIKVLQMSGGSGDATNPLGAALGPVAKTLLETSAVLPAINQLVQLGDGKALVDTVKRALDQPKPPV